MCLRPLLLKLAQFCRNTRKIGHSKDETDSERKPRRSGRELLELARRGMRQTRVRTVRIEGRHRQEEETSEQSPEFGPSEKKRPRDEAECSEQPVEETNDTRSQNTNKKRKKPGRERQATKTIRCVEQLTDQLNEDAQWRSGNAKRMRLNQTERRLGRRRRTAVTELEQQLANQTGHCSPVTERTPCNYGKQISATHDQDEKEERFFGFERATSAYDLQHEQKKRVFASIPEENEQTAEKPDVSNAQLGRETSQTQAAGSTGKPEGRRIIHAVDVRGPTVEEEEHLNRHIFRQRIEQLVVERRLQAALAEIDERQEHDAHTSSSARKDPPARGFQGDLWPNEIWMLILAHLPLVERLLTWRNPPNRRLRDLLEQQRLQSKDQHILIRLLRHRSCLEDSRVGQIFRSSNLPPPDRDQPIMMVNDRLRVSTYMRQTLLRQLFSYVTNLTRLDIDLIGDADLRFVIALLNRLAPYVNKTINLETFMIAAPFETITYMSNILEMLAHKLHTISLHVCSWPGRKQQMINQSRFWTVFQRTRRLRSVRITAPQPYGSLVGNLQMRRALLTQRCLREVEVTAGIMRADTGISLFAHNPRIRVFRSIIGRNRQFDVNPLQPVQTVFTRQFVQQRLGQELEEFHGPMNMTNAAAIITNCPVLTRFTLVTHAPESLMAFLVRMMARPDDALPLHLVIVWDGHRHQSYDDTAEMLSNQLSDYHWHQRAATEGAGVVTRLSDRGGRIMEFEISNGGQVVRVELHESCDYDLPFLLAAHEARTPSPPGSEADNDEIAADNDEIEADNNLENLNAVAQGDDMELVEGIEQPTVTVDGADEASVTNSTVDLVAKQVTDNGVKLMKKDEAENAEPSELGVRNKTDAELEFQALEQPDVCHQAKQSSLTQSYLCSENSNNVSHNSPAMADRPHAQKSALRSETFACMVRVSRTPGGKKTLDQREREQNNRSASVVSQRRDEELGLEEGSLVNAVKPEQKTFWSVGLGENRAENMSRDRLYQGRGNTEENRVHDSETGESSSAEAQPEFDDMLSSGHTRGTSDSE